MQYTVHMSYNSYAKDSALKSNGFVKPKKANRIRSTSYLAKYNRQSKCASQFIYWPFIIFSICVCWIYIFFHGRTCATAAKKSWIKGRKIVNLIVKIKWHHDWVLLALLGAYDTVAFSACNAKMHTQLCFSHSGFIDVHSVLHCSKLDVTKRTVANQISTIFSTHFFFINIDVVLIIIFSFISVIPSSNSHRNLVRRWRKRRRNYGIGMLSRYLHQNKTDKIYDKRDHIWMDDMLSTTKCEAVPFWNID